MDGHVVQIRAIAKTAREVISEKSSAREKVLPLCRTAIRDCANSIRAVHRGELETGRGLLDKAKEALDKAESALKSFPDIYYSGYLQDAQKEFAEGSILMNIVMSCKIPGPNDLGMPPTPYLNGMGEAAGELRRYIMDSLRRDDFSRCEEFLALMDEIYTALSTMDFPDALTGGLRRTNDMVRGVLERTRGDLTVALVQCRLEKRLSRL